MHSSIHIPPKITAWSYRWLPIIFGCHCRADRSFFYHGKQFPICARCTGECIGILTGCIGYALYHPPAWVCGILLLPMIADGLIQSLTSYTSTNGKRVLTGFLFGYSLAVLVLYSSIATVLWGYRFGQSLLRV